MADSLRFSMHQYGCEHERQRLGFGHMYVVVGHSAGATLAFQLLMGPAALARGDLPAEAASLPWGLIGVAGIYDLVGLDQRHGGAYGPAFAGAFGRDERAWRAA